MSFFGERRRADVQGKQHDATGVHDAVTRRSGSGAHRRAPGHAAARPRRVGRSGGIVLIAAVALALGMGGTAAYAALAGNAPAATSQDRVVMRGAVIRLGTHVYVHTNEGHASIGVKRIALVKKCRLRIYFDQQPGERIVAAVAEEDEAISRLGVQAGMTGGVKSADVLLYRNGKEVCANNKKFGTKSNLWISLTSLARAPLTTPTKAPTTPPAKPAPAPAPTTVAPAAPQTPAPARTTASARPTPTEQAPSAEQVEPSGS